MARHPLDSLTTDEYRRTTSALREAGHLNPSHRFASIALDEPAKADVLAWREGDRPVPRRSLSVLWDRADNKAYEALVMLGPDGDDSVVSWTHVPGVTPNFTLDEWHECEVAMKADPDVVAALAERGLTDLDLVLIDVWTYGHALMPEKYRDRRLGWADIWVRETPTGNPYAHPVSGLKLIVDMNTMELLEIDRSDDAVAPAPVMGEYEPDLVPGQTLRDDIKPLEITQPDGVSFEIDGNVVRWQNWSMRLGFNYREGPVIYQVNYDDHGTERDIAYRMSFAEMVVPYRDSSFDHYRRTAYDIGEWGLGYMTQSLELGCDCLGEIRYLDAVLTDSHGEPFTITNAICLHEEDNAVLWKHVDSINGRAEVRRARRFVVSVHATVANYEYLVYWRFYQDGNIECEVRATGIMVTTPFAEGAETPPTGTLVDHRTYAPFHQHFLVARLDMDVDGGPNTVLEVDSHAAPIGPDNPYGLALTTTATPIRSEAESGQGLRLDHPARLEGGQPRETERGRRLGRLQAGAGRRVPGADGPVHAPVPARAGDGPHALGHGAPRRREVALRERIPRRARATRGSPAGSPTTSRWRTRISCSGTSSASTTSPGPRTGRSCRWTRSRSGSSRSASSTGTRRWTSRRSRGTARTRRAARPSTRCTSTAPGGTCPATTEASVTCSLSNFAH